MLIRHPSQGDFGPANPSNHASSLVRRLVLARDDAARERLRAWLGAIDDERLLAFGLTPGEIAALRPFGKAGQGTPEL